ncbi:MAG: cellulase family glycosylhydrolase [Candidatus Omnitrophica bacterium]|nr:cellulase family glycosylhydrolase [Candidatus Omnitrophota bacterium]
MQGTPMVPTKRSESMAANAVINDRRIRGINLGGWLLMEGYILGGRNIPEHVLKNRFRSLYGEKALADFESSFRDNFINETDFRNIAASGAHCVRVPFHFRMIEQRPFIYDRSGFTWLDRVFTWAKKYRLKVILDLHAAPGAQNKDWHADSNGRAGLWNDRTLRERTAELWGVLAERYGSHPALQGYDILNEPVGGRGTQKKILSLYRRCIRKIRESDPRNMIFVEGDLWATQIDFLEPLIEENIHASIHTYAPLEYTFHFRPLLRYPGRIQGKQWQKRVLKSYLKPYKKFSEKMNCRIFVGEFGIHWRGGCWGEKEWLRDILEIFEEYCFDYTYWTYKSVKNAVFPDGLWYFLPNAPWVRREGPVRGWENYCHRLPSGTAGTWRREKRKIIDFWRTGSYTRNRELIRILKEYFKR